MIEVICAQFIGESTYMPHCVALRFEETFLRFFGMKHCNVGM